MLIYVRTQYHMSSLVFSCHILGYVAFICLHCTKMTLNVTLSSVGRRIELRGGKKTTIIIMGPIKVDITKYFPGKKTIAKTWSASQSVFLVFSFSPHLL